MLVFLLAAAQAAKLFSIRPADCCSTCSSESEWHVMVVGERRWTKLRANGGSSVSFCDEETARTKGDTPSSGLPSLLHLGDERLGELDRVVGPRRRDEAHCARTDDR